MTKTGWLALGIVIIVAVGAFLWWSNASAPSIDQGASSNAVTSDTSATSATGDTSAAGTQTTGASADVSANVTTGAPMSATVTYDGNSFSPASLTVAKGATVTFTDTAGQMWLASDPHPAHTAYDGTSRTTHCAAGYTGAKPFDECARGSSFTFTFDKTGTFGYHDHTNDNAHGTIVVQ